MSEVYRICKNCGNPFATRDKRQITCSLSCAASLPRRPLAERFWKKVSKTDSCWLWTGSFNSYGYGTIYVDKKVRLATHISWELAGNDKVPGGRIVCLLHNCPGGDNPACVNPIHLFLGTIGDNNTDRAKKGGNADQRGEKNHQAILTADQVAAIRARHAAGGVTQRTLAKEYGVHFANISDIVTGKSWRHIL